MPNGESISHKPAEELRRIEGWNFLINIDKLSAPSIDRLEELDGGLDAIDNAHWIEELKTQYGDENVMVTDKAYDDSGNRILNKQAVYIKGN